MGLNEKLSPQFQSLNFVYICKKKRKKKEGELVPCTPPFRRLCISILTRKRGYHLTRNIQFVLFIFINKSPWLYQLLLKEKDPLFKNPVCQRVVIGYGDMQVVTTDDSKDT